MCLVAIALGVSARYPLVVAANRDEFYDRPAAPLGWWRSADDAAPILGGRDLQGGGTWLALNAQGRLALLTNVREPASRDADAPSRGAIVPEWLASRHGAAAELHRRIATRGYNGFNLVVADFATGTLAHLSNRAGSPTVLGPGVHGVSNAGLDTPWPKVVALKARLAARLRDDAPAHALRDALFDALADRRPAPDAALPSTGVPLEWERLLSAAFIESPERGYGTRCSTLVLAERGAGGRVTTRVWERSFERGRPAGERAFELGDWPPGGFGASLR